MTETKTQLDFVGLERFGHLEDRIQRVVDSFKAVRKENDAFRAENQKLKGELETFRETQATVNQNLADLQKEREALKERVEKALSLLATLET